MTSSIDRLSFLPTDNCERTVYVSETSKKVAFNSVHIFENEMMKLVLLGVLILTCFLSAAVLAKREANFIM